MDNTNIGCLTPSVVNAPNTPKRGLTLIPFTPSLKSLVIGVICLWITSVQAQWTQEQKVLGAVSAGLMLIDYGQTRFIAKNTWTQHESNPMLGRYPSMGRVNRHFLAASLASYLVADFLPSEQRTWFLGGLAVVQLGVVAHNYSIGINTSF